MRQLSDRKSQPAPLLFCLLLLLTPSMVGAQTPNQERLSLRGLQGIGVLIEEIRGTAKEDGLTDSQLQTDVELRLRKAGIRIMTVDELKKSGTPYLYLNIQNIKDKQGRGYVYYVHLSVQQDVRLERKIAVLPNEPNQIRMTVATWERNNLGTLPGSDLRRVRNIVADQVDEFINDYLAENAK